MRLRLTHLFCCVFHIFIFICYGNSEKLKTPTAPNKATIKNSESSAKTYAQSTVSTVTERIFVKGMKISPILFPNSNKSELVIIPFSKVKGWAEEISAKLHYVEKKVVHPEILQKGFANVKMGTRDGAAIVQDTADALEDLLKRRVEAAENIMRKAEKLYSQRTNPDPKYVFDKSLELDRLKKKLEEPEEYERPTNCSSLRKVLLRKMTHFGSDVGVSLDISSVQVAQEVFECDDRVLPDIFWSEALLETFRRNYEQDAMTDFQYFCSAKGFLRHYPASEWSSFFKLDLSQYTDELADVYDCRLRPWYVAAGGAPRDILVLFDATGSLVNSTNKINAENFILALLSALTDDDQVNVLRFNEAVNVSSPIVCFNDKLVPSNYVNSAAMLAVSKDYLLRNFTRLEKVIKEAVKILQREQNRTEKPPSCQQAIILIADSIPRNYTDIIREADPTGRIRLFVIWLHDPFGLRDDSNEYGHWLSCASDGSFTELVTSNDVTEQVMKILRVMERPLVAQRRNRLRIFSDLYVHVEDPRRSEFYWSRKENDEQIYRYRELRKNKDKFLSELEKFKHFKRQESMNDSGQYYEQENIRYRLQISVSVPIFDETTSENITIRLAEERQRLSTRTYPVNRLLGVAGVDIPIDHLKLILPYYRLGAGGSLFIIDHRGNIVVHDNIKPVFEGDILRPGYRTVDMLDLEQPGENLPPRNYTKAWLDFRNALLIEHSKGIRTMFAKNIFDLGMRAIIEDREYHWRRILDHYTVVVVLPKYNRRYPIHEGGFTRDLAAKVFNAFWNGRDFAVHPEWLYCKHVDQHFDEAEFEVRHFVMRRKDEPDFPMKKLKHVLSHLPPTLLEKTYQCNEELMVRLCKEMLATEQWANEIEDECIGCELGAVTAFFATESGLTRWNQYRVTSSHADAPSGRDWSRGPEESWYKRAAAATPDTLLIHAPVMPIQRFRRAEDALPPRSNREKWLTAARALSGHDKGIIGVAGYHFYPKHLEDLVKSVSDHNCNDCDYRCDGVNWTCVLIDENGWLVAGHWIEEDEVTDEDPVREHLSRVYPHAMRALLDKRIFELNWIHDYQGVCFPSVKDGNTASMIMPTIIITVWKSIGFLFYMARELVTLVTILSTSGTALADTEFEREKRRNRTRRDYERERFERLHDSRVLVNRTTFSTCDRSRPVYVLTRDQHKLDLLKGPADACRWPLVGAPVPKTNLILLAIMNSTLCSKPKNGTKPNDPFVNLPVPIEDPPGLWLGNTTASRTACWRNIVPFPARASHSTCYPHDYKQEEGYRQCGPWLPDENQPEED